MARLVWWGHYTRTVGADMNNNPSPGNKAGGVTTINKLLGTVAKSGSSVLMAAYEYAESVTARALVFMDTPGYDPDPATAGWPAART